jgi:O-antigen ligase
MPLTALLVVLLLGAATTYLKLIRRSTTAAWPATLVTIQIPLLMCALIVNLKRGPWMGVLVGTVVFCFLYARRLVAVVVASAAILATLVAPVRERLLASYEHFTIEGGRSTIWRIGLELASEYPLGIGYHNSRVLRQFAPEIPPELNHFHNNLINIASEIGWLGLATFVWLLFAVVRTCFKDIRAPLYVAIGCAIISWQVAGLVEYNFGDSEVTLIVWVLLGLVIQRDLRSRDGHDFPTSDSKEQVAWRSDTR